MGLLDKLAGFLGLAREEEQEQHEESSHVPSPMISSGATQTQFFARRGFSVPVQVPVERAPPPLLLPCATGDGGLQGLRWYARHLRIDEDGDIGDEFLVEVLPDTNHNMSLPRFEVMKYNSRPAILRNLLLLPNGKIQHLVEYQGRLEWL